MISNLRKRTGSPVLTPPDNIFYEFSGDGDPQEWLSIEIMGYFRDQGRHQLEFKVINKLHIQVNQLIIDDSASHEITIDVEDSDDVQPTTRLYHLETSFNPGSTHDWSITYAISKGSRRRTWRMTKAEGGIPPG